LEIIMLTYSSLQTFALNQLKECQKSFNKNPNSSNWEAVTQAMLVHQQVTALKTDRNLHHLLERLSGLPLLLWAEAVVRHATGLSVRDILVPSITNV
jgi:hypothetical protein